MKKELLLVIVSFFLISLTAITGVYAIEENNKVITISKEELDLSGDGQNENIFLKGVPSQDEDSYLKKVYIEVDASNGKTYTFPLESGFKASLEFVDLNQDGLKDIFANVLTGERLGTVISYLYSLKDFARTEITVPEPLEMEANFSNGYKAEITLTETGKSYSFDLQNRKKYYKKLGFYNKGKLNEPTELSVNTYFSLKPVLLENNKPGLKGIQRVTGIANADTIALVESTWNYDHGQWKLASADIKQADIK